ncbi:DUF3822 family protein [Tenacibaculum maritimum]|uniref:DUF3822 family protein n=1 Tax=Tenacibaculum maritimum TaxID=107401 RepID=UPI0012E60713|nr:DUF3822 family protein [Tenacibaculum maritimum]CAA0228583.1 conserved hypothetical protein [Tenacibaculum maritimum]
MQKNSTRNNIVSEHKDLSVQFSLDGFSFCIKDALSHKPICFTKYSFDQKIATPELLLEKIEHIFSSDPDLQQDFKNTVAIHQSNLATLVPNEYFQEKELKTYLNYNIKTLATDFIAFDDLQCIEAKNVYVPYVNINNYLFQNFGEFEYRHHASVLIDKLLNHTKKDGRSYFFAHVFKSQLDIVVLKDNSLLLYNSYPFNTKEDFLYYLLFTAEQLGLDPNEFQLTFSGDIEENSAIYAITYQYIRNINFISTTSTFFNNSNDFSNHSNFILIS